MRLWPLTAGRRVRVRSDADVDVVRRAAWRFAVQTAVAVAVVVVLAAILMYVTGSQVAARQASERTRSAATTADDVTDPQPGVVLLAQRPGGPVRRSPNAPEGMSRIAPASLPGGPDRVRVGRLEYAAYTSVRPDGSHVTALADLRDHGEVGDRSAAILLGGGFGIVAAGLVGWFIGRRAMRPVGHALALQRRFVADASHELRTPLAALHLRVQLLRRRLSAGDPLFAEVERLEADSRTLDEILSDLLVSAQLSHRPDRSERVDVAALAGEVAETMRSHADAAGVVLTVRADAGVLVAGSRAALRRAVLALVDNAVAHARASVELGVRRDGGTVLVRVGDDGEGIDPARLDELTQRFARGQQTGRGRRFGLGLALVREVVRAHGGDLRVDRRAGGGSAFTLALPAAAAA
ncbi:MAG TPA: HAMP domain-containing sensor histidine kinase [Streptosporangiales bacterium]